ncbi:MAG TPA: SMC-Scp complex subunit ScpB [bacterium]
MSEENREELPAVPEGGTTETAETPEPVETVETVAAAKDIGLLVRVLEALVFVHRGTLTPKTVREALGEEYAAEEIVAGFAALKEEYARRDGAIVLLEVAGGYQLGTREDLAPWIQKLDFYEHHRHLSRPTLETLAIIAYKQPVTRAEIEAIRGVNVERIARNLIERKLVRILGHKEVPGRPAVLGTTREFLELFGINSLADLPPLKDFVEPASDAGIDEELPPQPVPEGEEDEAATPRPQGDGEAAAAEPAGEETGDGREGAAGDGATVDTAGGPEPEAGPDRPA